MKSYLLMVAVLAAGSVQAWDCAHERKLETTLDLADAQSLTVRAAAGDLVVNGRPGLTEAHIRGKLCASEEEWLDEARIDTEGGRNAAVYVTLPDSSGWSLMGSRYIYMDLEIDVPEDLALDISDSSGDIEIEGTGPLEVSDSSGDIDIERIGGGVVLEDSSGDIELEDIEGDVLVRRDSSGGIYGRGIEGSVRVERDSSGEIDFRDVRDDFVVERDSSGDIVADTIGGDFRVLKDGSGDIEMRGVEGAVEIPDKG
jgi:hypothetical protein